jgi:hypothetical protein
VRIIFTLNRHRERRERETEPVLLPDPLRYPCRLCVKDLYYPPNLLLNQRQPLSLE